MRVAVVYSGASSKLAGVSRALAGGIERAGHRVELIDIARGIDQKLSVYQYLWIGAVPRSVFGGIGADLGEGLASAGALGGRKSTAYLVGGAFGKTKALGKVMAVMEAQGMFVRASEFIRSPEHAEALGARFSVRP